MPGASVKVGPVRVGSGCCVALVIPVVIAVAIGVLLSGCSSNSSKKIATKHISTEEVKIANDSETFISASLKCIRAEREEKGDPGYIEGLVHDVFEIIEIFRKNPNAVYSDEPIRTILAKSAENLENCYRQDSQRIRNVLIYG